MKIDFYGPYELVANIRVTNGETDGTVEVSLGHGQIPDEEVIAEALDIALDELSEDYRLATKREWWDVVSIENFGGVTAFPGDPDKWDTFVDPRNKLIEELEMGIARRDEIISNLSNQLASLQQENL